MRKLKSLGVFLLAFGFFLSIQSLYAQGPPERPFPEEGKRERLKEELETLKMWKMLEALDLSSEQSDKFLPVWRDFQQAQRLFREKRELLFRELENALETEEKPKERNIQDILERLEKERFKLEEAQQRFRSKAKEILTLEQQAKLLLFEERFERRMMEIIKQYREKRRFGE